MKWSAYLTFTFIHMDSDINFILWVVTKNKATFYLLAKIDPALVIESSSEMIPVSDQIPLLCCRRWASRVAPEDAPG